jgi:hypothetical protein
VSSFASLYAGALHQLTIGLMVFGVLWILYGPVY